MTTPTEHLPSAEAAHLPAVIGPPSPDEYLSIKKMANDLAESKLVPDNLRKKPEDIAVIALTARELQIGPMQALNKVHVINGRPTLSAELMVALVHRAGHEVLPVDVTDTTATAKGRRRASEEWSEATFTIGDAERAGLLRNDTWKKHPSSMLWARAVSTLCRRVFPDVLMGASYVPEEMGATVDPDTGEVIEAPGELVDDDTVEKYRTRIAALDPTYRKALAERLTELGIGLGRNTDAGYVVMLTRRREPLFRRELEGVEAFDSMAEKDDGSDETVVEAQIVGEDDADTESPAEGSGEGEGLPDEAAGDGGSDAPAPAVKHEDDGIEDADVVEAQPPGEAEEVPGGSDTASPASGSPRRMVIGDHALEPFEATGGRTLWGCTNDECELQTFDVALPAEFLKEYPPPDCPAGDHDEAAIGWLQSIVRWYKERKAKADQMEEAAAQLKGAADDVVEALEATAEAAASPIAEHDQAVADVIEAFPDSEVVKETEAPAEPPAEEKLEHRHLTRIGMYSSKLEKETGIDNGRLRAMLSAWVGRPLKSRKELWASEVTPVCNVMAKMTAGDVTWTEEAGFEGTNAKGRAFLELAAKGQA